MSTAISPETSASVDTSISPCPAYQYTPYQWTTDKLIQATAGLQSYWFNSELPSFVTLMSTCISTDTRTIKQGDIFLALSGDNFDGHDYAQMAMEKGAVALIVERELTNINLPQLVVSDARLALGRLGAYCRQQHPNVKVIAITGSSGKTTVKEMLASVFNRLAPTLVTRGNLNNDLGVPMMLLELAKEHQFAILELGANHLGEIAYTADLVQPDVACVLNIGTAHLGEFGGRDKIAQAKAEIYQALTGADKIAIIPECDEYSDYLQRVASQYVTDVQRIVKFGKTDIVASDVQMQAFSSDFVVHVSNGQDADAYKVSLPLAGEHNVNNALAVIACARAVGIDMADIIAGLQAVKTPKGRLYRQQFGQYCLIDDSYNANPSSVRASAQVLSAQQGQTIMVLGDIGELGDSAKTEHYQLGADIAKMNIDKLYTLGDFAQTVVDGAMSVTDMLMNTKVEKPCSLQAVAYSDKQALLQALQADIARYQGQACTILFKGSRFMKMETLFEDLAEILVVGHSDQP